MSKNQLLFKCPMTDTYQSLMESGEQELRNVIQNFKGTVYRTPKFWEEILKTHLDLTRPLNYTEIGIFHGGNLLHFINHYPINQVIACDPFIDYADYTEYQNQQSANQKIFEDNFNQVKPEIKAKVNFIKDYSHNVLPLIDNNTQDIIYLDGNHNPRAILEDAILSWRKIRTNGLLIFDDYGWQECGLGIDTFIMYYKDYLKMVYSQNCQIIIKKTSDFVELPKTIEPVKLQPRYI